MDGTRSAATGERARRRPRGNVLLYGVAALLAGIGINQVVQAQDSQGGPPTPPASADRALPAPRPAPKAGSPSPSSPSFAQPMDFSVPLHIDVAQADIHAEIMSVGLAADGSVGVPPLNQALKAAWYDLGPAPGQLGTSIIDAHVDSSEITTYRGAFFNLGDIRPGETIDVIRSDNSVAIFTVDSVEVVLKSDFPSQKVYGPTPFASLRLITCGGDYDKKTHSYLSNTVVYAHLSAVRSSTSAARAE